MVTMTVIRESRAFTKADRDALPDDGRRHELIDGALLVTPSPSLGHQVALTELFKLLSASCPGHLYVLVAPLDVELGIDTVVQPDLLVVERRVLDEEGTPWRPLLVVEVLSPSTRRIDLTLKKARYEAAGVPAYWAIDPNEPSISAWTLNNGTYGSPQCASGADVLEVVTPYEITVVPSQLTHSGPVAPEIVVGLDPFLGDHG